MADRKFTQTKLVVHPFAEQFRLMEGEELQLLMDDIRDNGLSKKLTARALDADTLELLDGRNRMLALKRRGISGTALMSPQYIEVVDMPDDYVVAFIMSANVHRRHLTLEEKRKHIASLLVKNPEMSNTRIAEATGSTKPTVQKQRAELERKGKIPQVSVRSGADGKTYQQPAPRPQPRPPMRPGNVPMALPASQRLGVDEENHAAATAMLPTEDVAKSWVDQACEAARSLKRQPPLKPVDINWLRDPMHPADRERLADALVFLGQYVDRLRSLAATDSVRNVMTRRDRTRLDEALTVLGPVVDHMRKIIAKDTANREGA